MTDLAGHFRVPSASVACDVETCRDPAVADELLTTTSGPLWVGRCATHIGRPVFTLPDGRKGVQWSLFDTVVRA